MPRLRYGTETSRRLGSQCWSHQVTGASSSTHRPELLWNRPGTNDLRLWLIMLMCEMQAIFFIFCLPSISLNGMLKLSKMPPALAEMGFNKSLLSWDHLLKPNELADVGCEMCPCMSCRQLQPFESFAVHEERILMWLLMSTEDIRHLKMCPMTKLSTRTNEIQFVLGVLCR